MNNDGDTAYFANTDYNQRLEEKSEAEYENKSTKNNQIAVDDSLDHFHSALDKKNINDLLKFASLPMKDDEYIKLIEINDKDIHINLAKNINITDLVAKKLIGTVYLAHKELLNNPNIGNNIKQHLLEYMNNNTSQYAELINNYNNNKIT